MVEHTAEGWLIILTDLCIIIGLSGWVLTEPVNNIYFQDYVNSLAPVIVPLLGVALGITSASAATILYFGIRKPRKAESAHAVVGSVGSKMQSERRMRRSSPIGCKAAKHAPNPHHQATGLEQIACPLEKKPWPQVP